MTILDTIVQKRRESIPALYAEKQIEIWREQAFSYSGVHASFSAAMRVSGLSLIAEVKKASPSRGLIYNQFNPITLANRFESLGARALSVLTEPDFFQGSIHYLKAISEQTSLPLLRKDFIVDEVQLYESKLLGASAILLIRSALSETECLRFAEIAQTLKLDVLLEIHDLDEFLNSTALYSLPVMWGINNRNLKTFDMDLSRALALNKVIKQELGPDVIVVAESGYQTQQDLDTIQRAGLSAVLIGEGLAKNPDLIQFFGGQHED